MSKCFLVHNQWEILFEYDGQTFYPDLLISFNSSKKLEGLRKTFLFPIDHSICQAFIPMGIFCSIFRFAFMFVSCFQCFQCLRWFEYRVTTVKRHKGKLWNFNYYKATLFIISHSCIQKKLREWMLLNGKPDYINFL